MASIFGTVNIDNLFGTSGNDEIYGLDGNDSISGEGGFDTIYGDGGNDRIDSGYAQYLGSGRRDLDADFIDGGAGNDVILASHGNDTLIGGEGSDVLNGYDGNDLITGGVDTDPLSFDTINGGDGNDTLSGGGGKNLYSFDQITEGNDVIADFSLALDQFSFSGSVLSIVSGVDSDNDGALDDCLITHNGGTVALLNNNLSGYLAVGSAASNNLLIGANVGSLATSVFFGLDGNDVISVDDGTAALTAQNITIDGGNGDDLLTGGAGEDMLQGGFGADTLIGGAGADNLSDIGGVTLFDGGAGNDTVTIDLSATTTGNSIIVQSASFGSLSFQGGTTVANAENFYMVTGLDNDLIDLRLATTSINSDIQSALTIGGEYLTGVEIDLQIFALGNSGNDTIEGSEGQENLSGDFGNDVINGNGGQDQLYGGFGNDSVSGGAGDDYLRGDSGFILETASTTANSVSGGDTLRGGDGNDTLADWAGADILDGGAGYDTAYYFNAVSGINFSFVTNSVIQAGEGNDTLIGVEGVWASTWDDTIVGDSGDNSICGLGGADTITGGAGRDSFEFTRFNASDSNKSGTFTDYVTGSDRVSGQSTTLTLVTGIDADGDGANDDSAFRSGTTSASDQIRLLNVIATDVMGTSASNVIAGTTGSDGIYGWAGNDSLSSGLGDDMLDGGSGNDTLNGGTGLNALYGGSGDDTFFINGADHVVGGTGLRDTASFIGAGVGVTVNLALQGTNQTIASQQVMLLQVEDIVGSDFQDVLTGDYQANILTGLNGDDTLDGQGGNDVLIGGFGNNVLRGGAGFDLADVSFVLSSIYVDLAFQAAGGVQNLIGGNQIRGIEGIILGGGNDTVVGSAGTDYVDGRAGNDFVTTGAGDDYLAGGMGSDTLIGGNGDDMFRAGNTTYLITDPATTSDVDYVYAGAGDDKIIDGGRGIDILLGEDGNDTINDNDGLLSYIYGGAGNNTITSNAQTGVFISQGAFDYIASNSASAFYYRYADGRTNVVGSSGVDQFIGGAALSSDGVFGGMGNDFLFGGNGDDDLAGGGDNDVLIGQNGNDTLEGGAGVNLLWANDAGSDQILVNVADAGTQVVEFFEAGGTNDVVRLLGSSLTSFADFEALKANIGNVVGTNLLVNSGSGAQLYLNLGANQAAIWFQGVSAYSLTSGDFLFG